MSHPTQDWRNWAIVPRRRLELPSNEALVYALKKGYGIAAISRYVVAAELRAGSLAVIRVPGWNVRNIVSVLRVRDAKLTPSADRLQTFVRTGSVRWLASEHADKIDVASALR